MDFGLWEKSILVNLLFKMCVRNPSRVNLRSGTNDNSIEVTIARIALQLYEKMLILNNCTIGLFIALNVIVSIQYIEL